MESAGFVMIIQAKAADTEKLQYGRAVAQVWGVFVQHVQHPAEEGRSLKKLERQDRCKLAVSG